MNKKRLLFVSNLYPNPLQPHMASFNRQQIAALSHHFEIEVIAPVSWVNGWQKGSFPRSSLQGEVLSHHPTYWYTPGWGRRFYGQYYYRSIRKLALRLHRQKAFDFVFGAWLYPDGWAAAKLAEEFNVPLFLKVHGTDVNCLKQGTYLAALAMRSIARAQKVFCVSLALKDRLVELGGQPEKLIVVYNGVDKKIFYPQNREAVRRALGFAEDKSLVLYVGNLKKSKGLEELAVAFGHLKRGAKFNSLNMAVVGNGPYLPQFKMILQNEGCDESVQFLGLLSLDKVALWMNAADILCLPSHMEGTPNVILESLSCNTSVVATSVGGIPELACKDGRVKLAAPRDCDSLQTALERTLQTQPVEGKRCIVQSWCENASLLAFNMHKDS